MKEFTAQGHYIFQRHRTANVGEFPSDLEALHAAACLNACHHVPDPEVTIPALVEALKWMHNHARPQQIVQDITGPLLSKLNPSDT